MSFSGDGGVERMVANLLQEFVRRGHAVDLLLIKARGSHLAHLPPEVNRIKLGPDHAWLCIPALARYLRKHKPQSLLAAKHRAISVAVIARALAGVDTCILGRLGTNLSRSLKGKSRLRRWLWYSTMRAIYPHVDRIVPVSNGVAEDVGAITGIATGKMEVIRNPVITPELATLAAAPLDHPWLQPGQPPVILGMGRFTAQKDFLTLIRAFAEVRRRRDCRLMLLGHGALQGQYEALARELGVERDIGFPGFARNPYAYLSRASLFVLSSAWEGSPNALSEALALGIPSVSTDCESGPREILDGGRYGPLVPVGDHAALAQAMLQTLDHPLPAALLKEAVTEYTAATSAQRYLSALGIEG